MKYHPRLKICSMLLGLLLLAGCAGTRTVDKDTASLHLTNSDYKQYALQYLDAAGEPKYDRESLLDALEAGKAFHDAGLWEFSDRAFSDAHNLMAWKEDSVDTPSEVANLLGTTLTNDTLGAYQGKIYQGGLIDYYQSINMLMLGNEDWARVSFNRLNERQDNAVTQLRAYVKSVNANAGKSDDKDANTLASKSLGEIESEVATGVAAVPTGLKQNKIRNATGDAVASLFRSSSADKRDLETDSRKQGMTRAIASSASTEGSKLLRKLQGSREFKRQGLKNKVVVLYEDGTGPTLEEFRIDLPLFLVTDKVTYTGIALPKFVPGTAAFGSLRINNGKASVNTVTLTNINDLAGLEFESGYRGVVAKAVISTVLKTAAQAVINHQIERETGGGLLGSLLKVGVGAAQYALTSADTRTWHNLPNTLQMAIIDKPASGTITISDTTGRLSESVSLPEGENALVLVKASGVAAPPTIYTQSLPVSTKVAAL